MILLVFVIGSLMSVVQAMNNQKEQISAEGDITKYDILHTTYHICVNANGTVFATAPNNKIVKMTESGSYTEYNAPTSIGGASPSGGGGYAPFDIAVYDNETSGVSTIYYTSNSNANIEKMTETGTVTKIPAYPSFGLCINSNGTVFVCHQAEDKIGKITDAGVYSYYSLPSETHPLDIAVNSNGTLYFTTFDGDVYRLYESGSYSLICEADVSGAMDIKINSNNTIYIGSCNDGNVVRIYESGSHFHLFAPNGFNGDMAINEHNRIYYPTYGDKIGKITESGSNTYFDMTVGEEGVCITINENGTVWIGEVTGTYILKMEGEGEPPAYTPPTIDVTRPAGGEIWTVGDDELVYWNITDGTAPYSVWANYTADDGDSWYPAHAVIEQGAGANNFAWTIPNSPSEECYLNITIVDDDMGRDNDETSYFTIVYPSFDATITNPAGDEEWEVGSVQDINWTATGGIGDLLINLSYAIEIEGSFTNITNEEENDGGYEWTIPNTPSATVWIRINASDENGVEVSNFSEMFAIVAVEEPPITQNDITIQVTHPTTSYTGDTITIYVDVSIDSSTDEISSVTIYYRYEGKGYQSVAMELTAGTEKDGTWTGTIPRTTTVGTLEFYVKANADNGVTASTTTYEIDKQKHPEASTTPSTTLITSEVVIGTAVVIGAGFLMWLAWTVKPAVVLILVGAVIIIIYVFVM